ncbi:MAG: rod shape-determining protein RodA [Actinobacteria bacterium]|nr:rod shape-determining protein RodA [Actinomycetota bacterium]
MDVGYYGSDRNQRILRERIQDRWMDAYAPTRHLDPVLVLTVLALSAIGVAAVYSATFHRLQLQGADPGGFMTKQLINVAVGVVGMVVAAVVDYRYARVYSPLIYLGALGLLVVVLTPLGTTVNGSQSWINLGGFQLQPSELAKVALVVALAAVLHERKGDPNVPSIAACILLLVVPAGLILLQPDFGTFLVFPFATFILLLVGGTKARYLIGLAIVAVGGAAAVLRLNLIELEEYQIARLTAFLDPGNTEIAKTAAYNTNQSLIAIGSGGFAGKGFLEGTQTNLSYVPENHTDFIFTVIGEEFGFLGALVMLALFAVLLWRGLRIAALAKDLFGTLLATGAVAIFTVQLFVNVGMTVGIMPVTGIPLPFVSYGGTSMLASFLLVGLMLNVHMRRF